MRTFHPLLCACIIFISGCTKEYRSNPYYTPKQGQKQETFAQARKRFERMTVRQISNIDMCTLTHVQLDAFKDLASSIFRCEIASAGCFSQANRRKYEVMYQKIGESDLCRRP